MPGVTIIRPETLPREPVNHPGGASKMVLIPGGVVPLLTQFAQASFSKGDRIEPHSHDGMTEIFYLVSGAATCLGRQEETLRPGDAVLVPPGEIHGFFFIEESCLIYLGVLS
jgi:quercetin dioxygenase-like cupin family protein